MDNDEIVTRMVAQGLVILKKKKKEDRYKHVAQLQLWEELLKEHFPDATPAQVLEARGKVAAGMSHLVSTSYLPRLDAIEATSQHQLDKLRAGQTVATASTEVVGSTAAAS